ncbi:phosphatase PAP2 family protein [Fusibacter paucivorans]|uniref:Phosphatase PAP2 family protein n=1 Tax=Fusibacter paucivorans TaxID=76009 RepID=A0ABS5PME6_9FIRM|nr:phosphatase PAP2 family protein [Fusibacter paucivorans]MBS7526349.1 phosphatase PAP2 family protein [Fusibacter paucivorans]
MRSLKTYLSENKHFYWVLLLLPLLVWFKLLEFNLVPKYMVHSFIDDLIPFSKIFIIPYILWFPYIAYGVLFTGKHSRADYLKLLIFIGGGMSIAYLFYMLFPNAQALRPTITDNDPLSLLVRFIYWSDTPTNVFPSIHVINAVAVDAALHHSEAFSQKKGGKWLSSLMMILICLSTVFVKQHSILDVAGGLIVSGCFIVPLYLIPKRRSVLAAMAAQPTSE